jgi:hypothetical protein
MDSIATLATQRLSQALVGAGTVLRAGQVREVHAAGGQLIVSPNFHAEVVREAVAPGHGLPARRDDTHRSLRRAGRRRQRPQAVSRPK